MSSHRIFNPGSLLACAFLLRSGDTPVVSNILTLHEHSTGPLQSVRRLSLALCIGCIDLVQGFSRPPSAREKPVIVHRLHTRSSR